METANTTYRIEPHVGVGPIRFGMRKKEVERVLGKPADTYKDFLDRTVEVRGDVSVKYGSGGKVNEVSFLQDADVWLGDISILKDRDAVKRLDALDKPEVSVGYRIYFGLGLMLTGFGRKKEAKTVSVFAKELESLLRG